MPTRCTVVVVDDDEAALASTRWLLESDGLAVETCSSASEFLASFKSDFAGCIVLDLRMPGMDGLELQKKLKTRGYHLPIVFLSGHGDVLTCAEAMKTGAVDFLEKPAGDKDLLDAVHRALDKGGRRRSTLPGAAEITARLGRLTPREREVMLRLSQGDTIKTIAAKFGISFQTVAKHRTRVLEKLDVRNEAGLVHLLKDYPFET